MKVKVTQYGTIHAYAQCRDCSWDDVINTDEGHRRLPNLRNRIRSHVSKTGHRVTLETGNSTDYYT